MLVVDDHPDNASDYKYNRENMDRNLTVDLKIAW